MHLTKFKSWFVFTAVLGVGFVAGLLMPANQIRQSIAEIFELQSIVVAEDAEDDQSLNVEITETAQKSLGLKIRRVSLGNYQSTYEVPAIIQELSTAKSLSISSRFEGIIKKVFVSEGQSVKAGDLIFDVELTGELLSKTQTELLLAINKIGNIEKELVRLQPLVQEGGIANKRVLEMTYQQNQLMAEIDAKQQELLLLGLNQEQVDSITNSKKLIRFLQVRVPEQLLAPQLNLTLNDDKEEPPTFIIEKLFIKPGAVAHLGASLCDVAFHEHLVVVGQAYEKDLPMLRQLLGEKADLSVFVGTAGNAMMVPGGKIAYIDNHADKETNTFAFYVYLKNELISSNTTTNGQLSTPSYLTWRWKPGQRAHLRIPSAKYDEMLIVPRDAIAEDGVSRVVFQWKGQVAHDHEHQEDENHEHADEYQPLEVNVVFMDRETAVIDPKGRLKEGTRIAINNANQLMFSMQTGGGHSHSHDHEH